MIFLNNIIYAVKVPDLEDSRRELIALSGIPIESWGFKKLINW